MARSNAHQMVSNGLRSLVRFGHQTEIEEKYQRFMETMKSAVDLENEIVIEIGVREYVIDFAQMIHHYTCWLRQ